MIQSLVNDGWTRLEQTDLLVLDRFEALPEARKRRLHSFDATGVRLGALAIIEGYGDFRRKKCAIGFNILLIESM